MLHGEVEDQEDEWLLRRAQEVVANSARPAARIAVVEERKMAGQHENGGARGGIEASEKSSRAESNQAVLRQIKRCHLSCKEFRSPGGCAQVSKANKVKLPM